MKRKPWKNRRETLGTFASAVKAKENRAEGWGKKEQEGDGPSSRDPGASGKKRKPRGGRRTGARRLNGDVLYAELLCQNDSNWKAVSASRTKRQKLLKGKSVRTLVPRPPTARPTAFILRHGSQSIGVPSHLSLPAFALIARIRKRRTNLSSGSPSPVPATRPQSTVFPPRAVFRDVYFDPRPFLQERS